VPVMSAAEVAAFLDEPGHLLRLATVDDDAWRDLYRDIAYRYVDKDAADAYVDNTIDQPRALLAVPLSGSKVTTWRMPLEGENQTGIWHRRYYLDGTLMARVADGEIGLPP
jgi:hypothetical protein